MFSPPPLGQSFSLGSSILSFYCIALLSPLPSPPLPCPPQPPHGSSIPETVHILSLGLFPLGPPIRSPLPSPSADTIDTAMYTNNLWERPLLRLQCRSCIVLVNSASSHQNYTFQGEAYQRSTALIYCFSRPWGADSTLSMSLVIMASLSLSVTCLVTHSTRYETRSIDC